MTLSVVITLIACFLWAVTNHIDKYMLCNIESNSSNIKTLLIFSSLVAGSILSPIWLIINKFKFEITILSLIAIFISAIFYMIATYFYYKALEKNDASIVVVMFQLIPVFTYIFSLIFFNEILSIKEIIGALIIISSPIFISYDFNKNDNQNKYKALIFMTISSLLYSLYFMYFDFAIRNSDYNSVAFSYQISLIIVGLFLLGFKSYRISFKRIIKSNGKKFLFLNIINEVMNLAII